MRKFLNLLLAFVLTITLTSCGKKEDKKQDDPGKNEQKEELKEELKELTIIDVNSNSRPIAVMINNHPEARPYQSGLQDAYLVYEMIVEGGITRYMAVVKDKDTARIGSVRSSRHYYLDYVLENDAIYTHFGGSDRALNDIPKLGINNINGLVHSGFWRDSLPVAYEHTAFTSMENIKSNISNYGYRNTTTQDTLLNYVVGDVDNSALEGAIMANNVTIPYSYSTTTSYTYDSTNKVYNRFVNGVAHTDYVTKAQYNFKNIIIIDVNNYSLDSYGLQELENKGTGTGYYITNGYAVPITWEKTSRESQTVYKYLNGEEIKVSDGNTFIQIKPAYENATIN